MPKIFIWRIIKIIYIRHMILQILIKTIPCLCYIKNLVKKCH